MRRLLLDATEVHSRAVPEEVRLAFAEWAIRNNVGEATRYLVNDETGRCLLAERPLLKTDPSVRWHPIVDRARAERMMYWTPAHTSEPVPLDVLRFIEPRWVNE